MEIEPTARVAGTTFKLESGLCDALTRPGGGSKEDGAAASGLIDGWC